MGEETGVYPTVEEIRKKVGEATRMEAPEGISGQDANGNDFEVVSVVRIEDDQGTLLICGISQDDGIYVDGGVSSYQTLQQDAYDKGYAATQFGVVLNASGDGIDFQFSPQIWIPLEMMGKAEVVA